MSSISKTTITTPTSPTPQESNSHSTSSAFSRVANQALSNATTSSSYSIFDALNASLKRRASPPVNCTSASSSSSSLNYFQTNSGLKTPKRKTFDLGNDPFAQKVLGYINSNSITKNEITYNLESRRLQGEHSEVKFFLEGTPPFSEEVNNSQLVVKLFKEECFEDHGRSVERDLLPYSLAQYKQLCDDYSHLPEAQKPFARIYNSFEAQTDAFIVEEKVTPFVAPLWTKDTDITNLTQAERSTLDQIKALFHYSYVQNDTPGLDLKWSNIAMREGSNIAVIFDYYEYEDLFYILARANLENLSCGSPSIRAHILEGLLDKCVQGTFLHSHCTNLISNT